jgi:transcriptional regulator with PAS, ATPase and Fis domain
MVGPVAPGIPRPGGSHWNLLRRSTGRRGDVEVKKYVRATGRFYILLNKARRRIIHTALAKHHGNRTHAAEALGLRRTHLVAMIRKSQEECW